MDKFVTVLIYVMVFLSGAAAGSIWTAVGYYRRNRQVFTECGKLMDIIREGKVKLGRTEPKEPQIDRFEYTELGVVNERKWNN